jgi:hypothetical protein
LSAVDVDTRAPARDRVLGLVADVAPFAFAVPVLLGIGVSIVRLLSVGHPDLGWATTVNSDAEALYLGIPIHQDPADGYTGQLYTPLFPFVVSLLHHLHFWTGWPVLLAELSGLGFVLLAAFLARRELRPWSILGALGIGALGWWAVSGLDLALLYDGRADQFAWLAAIGGLVATAYAARTPERRGPLLLALALLTAAFWTKQNTIPASISAVGWLGILALCGALAWRRVLVFAVALLVVNLGVLGVLNLISGGWEWRLNFVLPSHHSQSSLITPWIREGLSGGLMAFAFLAVMAVIVLVRRPSGRRPTVAGARHAVAAWHERSSARVGAAGPLACFLAIGFLAAVYFRRKQGGADNQFLGAVWASVMLGAILWSVAGDTLRRGLVAGLAVVAGLLLVWSGVFDSTLRDHGVNVRTLHPEVPVYGEVSADLRARADEGLVYHTTYSDLNVQKQRVIYTNYYNFTDLLAAGSQPLALAKAFLDRKFLYVERLPTDPGTADYSSAYGKWEENWMWKVDQMIDARYEANAATPGLLKRRSGPEREVWQRQCFGSFDLAGTSWRIGRGGGLWCNPAPGQMTQRGTPAVATELRTEDAVDGLTGVMKLRVTPGHGLVVGGDGVALHLDRTAPTRYLVTLVKGTDTLAEQAVTVSRDGLLAVTLKRGDGVVAVDGPGAATAALPLGETVVSLTTNQGSDLQLDLAGVEAG